MIYLKFKNYGVLDYVPGESREYLKILPFIINGVMRDSLIGSKP
jgi:hypothetical protein